LSHAADALIDALVSILGSLLTFNVGIRQVRRSVTSTCWSNSGPRGSGLSSPRHPQGFSASPSPLRLPQPARGRSTKAPIRPRDAYRDNDDGDGQRRSARAHLAPTESGTADDPARPRAGGEAA
jgi:hypothetical protein